MGDLKNIDFALRTVSAEDAQQLAAIVSLGMCVAVKLQCVTPTYACDALFRPSLSSQLQRLAADPALCEILDEADELESVAKISDEARDRLLDRIMNTMIEYLKTHNFPDQQEGTNWTMKYP